MNLSIFADLKKENKSKGEFHPKAKLSNAEVEMLRKLREDENWSYGKLATYFEINKAYVQSLCTYRTRQGYTRHGAFGGTLDGMGTKMTPEKMTAFCAALAKTAQVGRACKAIGISQMIAYRWRRDDLDFALAWDEAMQVDVSTAVLAIPKQHAGVKILDMEDIPIGSMVSTPTGRIGIAVKHHTTSKVDHFQRISVQFGKNPRDGVVLQPHLLTIIEFYKWSNPDAKTLAMRIAKLCD